MRIACWRATFTGTVTIPGDQWKYGQTVQTRSPEGTNAGTSTPEVTLTWCGSHLEIAGPKGIAIVPAHGVVQADAIVVDGRVVEDRGQPRKPVVPEAGKVASATA